jgi:hypothetical protein
VLEWEKGGNEKKKWEGNPLCSGVWMYFEGNAWTEIPHSIKAPLLRWVERSIPLIIN